MKKKMRRITISIVITLCVILGFSNLLVFGQDLYSDLDHTHWAYKNIMEMAEAGIISGYPDRSFRPNGIVTYGEFIKMAVMAAGHGEHWAKEGGHWALPYYNSGLNNFLFSQYDISEAKLDRPIHRAHMALIASEILRHEKDYGDHSEISAQIWDVDHRTQYEHHIVRAYGMGILAGYPDGSFQPFGTLNRAEAAAVISRISERLSAGEEGSVQNLQGSPSEDTPSVGSPIPSTEPLVSTEIYDTSAPDGTFMARMRNLDGDLDAEKIELRNILLKQFPGEGQAIFDAFVVFSSMDSGGKTLGICKQYVMEYPILINLLGDGYDIRIYPKDYSDEYWETEPGQINVFFI